MSLRRASGKGRPEAMGGRLDRAREKKETPTPETTSKEIGRKKEHQEQDSGRANKIAMRQGGTRSGAISEPQRGDRSSIARGDEGKATGGVLTIGRAGGLRLAPAVEGAAGDNISAPPRGNEFRSASRGTELAGSYALHCAVVRGANAAENASGYMPCTPSPLPHQ